jgi:hypothetical protein
MEEPSGVRDPKGGSGLTAEEVALMWRTAPPRMPGEPPSDAGELADRSFDDF